MSEFATNLPRVTDDPVTDARALSAVLARVDDGRLSREEGLTVLQALGLAPSVDGGTYRPFGQRESKTATVRRRRRSRGATPPRVPGGADRPAAGEPEGSTGHGDQT